MWVEADVLKVPAFPEADVAATNDEVAPDEPAEAAEEGVLRLTWLWIYLLAPALVTVLTAFLRSLVVHQAEAAEPAADEAASDHGEPAPEVGAKRRPLAFMIPIVQPVCTHGRLHLICFWAEALPNKQTML